jgi:ABC-type Fe3+/spermidine/putrescine transport system ATPase subunit
MDPILTVRDIHKRFDDPAGVLHGISLEVQEGEIVCLLGPSGCGKTTLLRVIAGLEAPDRGQVLFAGQEMSQVPVHQRGFGLMFQDFALFPHKDVAANVAFGLRMQRWPPDRVATRVLEMLDLVNLGELAHRNVHQLSGGEQQRVALARSLAPQPRLLMLDEPMGSLDRTLRDRLLEELQRILKQVGVTVLYVTHDQGEAFAIADRIVLMFRGQVLQTGTPGQVYRQPRNAWAARFLGMQNLLLARWAAPGLVQTEAGPFHVAGEGEGGTILLIRPEAASVGATGPETLRGALVARSFRGGSIHIVVQSACAVQLAFDLPTGSSLPEIGQPVTLTLSPDGLICLEE